MSIEEIAIDIADQAEALLLESSCHSISDLGFDWFNVADIEPASQGHVNRAIAYLSVRMLLHWHPTCAQLVRVPTINDLGDKATEELGK